MYFCTVLGTGSGGGGGTGTTGGNNNKPKPEGKKRSDTYFVQWARWTGALSFRGLLT